jgi:hypothetical protein
MSKQQTSDYIYDSCKTLPQNLGFCVSSGKPKMLVACGIPDGVEIAVEFAVGNPRNDCWCTLNGIGPLTAEDNVIPITLPGTYQLNVEGVPDDLDPCLKVVCEELEEEDAKCILAPFTVTDVTLDGPVDAAVDLTSVTSILSEMLTCLEQLKEEETTKDTVTYTSVPFQEIGTCIPLVAQIACVDGEIVTPYPLGYIDGTGAFTMSTSFEPYTPTAGAETCAQAQVSMFELIGDGVDITVDAVAAAMIADGAPVFEFPGKAPVAATPADLSNITVIRKPCGATDSADNEVTIDYLTVNGAQIVSYTDDKEGGVDLTATLNVPVGACVLISACFEQCLTKPELAALA